MVSFDYGENTADSGIVWKTTKGRCGENSMKILARGYVIYIHSKGIVQFIVLE